MNSSGFPGFRQRIDHSEKQTKKQRKREFFKKKEASADQQTNKHKSNGPHSPHRFPSLLLLSFFILFIYYSFLFFFPTILSQCRQAGQQQTSCLDQISTLCCSVSCWSASVQFMVRLSRRWFDPLFAPFGVPSLAVCLLPRDFAVPQTKARLENKFGFPTVLCGFLKFFISCEW